MFQNTFNTGKEMLPYSLSKVLPAFINLPEIHIRRNESHCFPVQVNERHTSRIFYCRGGNRAITLHSKRRLFFFPFSEVVNFNLKLRVIKVPFFSSNTLNMDFPLPLLPLTYTLLIHLSWEVHHHRRSQAIVAFHRTQNTQFIK